MALIERAYSAGLERQVQFEKGEQPIVVAGNCLARHGREIDEMLFGLCMAADRFEAGDLRLVVDVHGRFTNLLRGVTRKGALSPRSFASKYLHFHFGAVPIYDEYVRVAMNRLVPWDRSNVPFGLPPDGDPQYWKYCVRFFRLYEACLATGVDVSVKNLDAYLWAVPAPN